VDTFPKSLTHLTFGEDFNQSIDLSKLDSLIQLDFGGISNDKDVNLSNLVPLTLTHLKFGYKFNKEVDLSNFISLSHLEFGSYFDQVFLNDFPKSLTHLTFGYNFNQSIDLSNLVSLTHLKFGNKFNQEVNSFPKSLTHLDLGGNFNKSIGHLIILPNLESIKPIWAWKKYEQKRFMCKGKVFTKHIILKQGISNSKKYGQLFLLFEKMCKEVKSEKDIYKLRGMAKSLEIKGVNNKTKEELCSEIGAEILIKLNLAKRFE